MESWEGSKDLLSGFFCRLPFLYRGVCVTKGKPLTRGKQFRFTVQYNLIFILVYFFGWGGICLEHIPVSLCVYLFCSGFSLEMPGFGLFLVSENTWGGFCHLASACPALHAKLWKFWRGASLLVVPKGENEVALTHQRLLPHPQLFQLHLGKINTQVPRTI